MEKDKEENLKTKSQDKDSLIEYLKNKANSHKRYAHYSTLETIEKIIDEKHLLLSNGKSWNDVDDKDRLNKEEYDKINFSFSLTYSYSENVAMWMLYGGMERNGAMLSLGSDSIRKILKANSVSLGTLYKGKLEEKIFLDRQNFDIEIMDILYFGESTNDGEENMYETKRARESAHIKREVVDSLGYCIKAFPWNYENECRIVVSVPKMTIFDKVGTLDKITHASIDISNIKSSAVICAPNSENNNQDYKKSKLNGKIYWDLCKNCNR